MVQGLSITYWHTILAFQEKMASWWKDLINKVFCTHYTRRVMIHFPNNRICIKKQGPWYHTYWYNTKLHLLLQIFLIWNKYSSHSTIAEAQFHSWVHNVKLKKDQIDYPPWHRSLCRFHISSKVLCWKMCILPVLYPIKTSVKCIVLYHDK